MAALGLGARAPSPAPGPSDWRTPDPAWLLVIDTNKGRILVELAPEVAPAAAAQVVALTRAGFYDGRTFFRVIDGFMDQTGDPQDNGQGGSTRPDLPPEFTFKRGPQTPFTALGSEGGQESGFLRSLPVISQPMANAPLMADGKVNAYASFCPGVVGMARAQDPGSGNSQFFLMRGSSPHLDQSYTAVGRAVAGLDVIRAIKTGEPVAPPQDKIVKMRVAADLPPAERPKVRVIDPAGPWMRAEWARVQAAKVVGSPLCDIELAAEGG